MKLQPQTDGGENESGTNIDRVSILGSVLLYYDHGGNRAASGLQIGIILYCFLSGTSQGGGSCLGLGSSFTAPLASLGLGHIINNNIHNSTHSTDHSSAGS